MTSIISDYPVKFWDSMNVPNLAINNGITQTVNDKLPIFQSFLVRNLCHIGLYVVRMCYHRNVNSYA